MTEPNGQQKRGWSTFGVQQKVGFIVFAFTGLLGVILGIVYIANQMRSPFVIDYQGDDFLFASERRTQEERDQQNRDTDGDGLNDYDELNVYRTSPYLADSDSDGQSDGDELRSGADPNCPTGETCGRAVDAVNPSPLIATDITDEVPFEDVGLGEGVTLSDQITTEQDLEAFLSQLTTEDIRAALLQQGIDQATLDTLSDEELRTLFDQALAEISDQGGLEGVVPAN